MADDDRPVPPDDDAVRFVTAEDLSADADGAPRKPMIDLGAPSGEVQLPVFDTPVSAAQQIQQTPPRRLLWQHLPRQYQHQPHAQPDHQDLHF